MPDLGIYLLYLALFASIYAVISGVVAAKTRRLDLTISSERAVTAQFTLIALAFLILEYLFLTDRFDVFFVAKSSSRDLPTPYKITALWSAMEGSLLLWSLVLASFTFAAVHIVKRRRVETATVEHPYGRDEHCFALAFSFLDPIARRPERALIGFSRRFHD